MRLGTRLWLLATVVGATLVGAGLVTGGARQEPRPADAAPTATASHLAPESVPTAKAQLLATVEADAAKPRYLGLLGDFLLVATEEGFRSNAPCRVVSSRDVDGGFAPSELNLRDMTEQGLCADGTVVNVHALEGSRFYFTERPKIAANAPLDRIELRDIDGYPALIISPAAGLGPHWVYVIQRAATADRPGIFAVVDSREGLEAATGRARELVQW